MKIIKQIWDFLYPKKVEKVSEPITDTATASTTPVVADQPVITVNAADGQQVNVVSQQTDVDAVLAKVKKLLIDAEHDIETEWDALVTYAKALASK